jgi:hypothetical protein
MALTFKTTHASEALANLAAQFKGKPKLASLINTLSRQIQELEDVFYQLVTERWIDYAEGAQLDGFGSIVGEARESRPDLEYRTAIKARMQLNIGDGTIQDIQNLLRGLAGDVRVQVLEFFPAAFIANVVDPIDPTIIDPTKLWGIVQQGKPAGVEAILTFGVLGSFRYDVGPGFDIGKYGGGIA